VVSRKHSTLSAFVAANLGDGPAANPFTWTLNARTPPKSFRWREQDDAVSLYRLPDLLNRPTVALIEGEKGKDRLCSLAWVISRVPVLRQACGSVFDG
jgi:hypothetical protein